MPFLSIFTYFLKDDLLYEVFFLFWDIWNYHLKFSWYYMRCKWENNELISKILFLILGSSSNTVDVAFMVSLCDDGAILIVASFDATEELPFILIAFFPIFSFFFDIRRLVVTISAEDAPKSVILCCFFINFVCRFQFWNFLLCFLFRFWDGFHLNFFIFFGVVDITVGSHGDSWIERNEVKERRWKHSGIAFLLL